jgi:hypothetical protein
MADSFKHHTLDGEDFVVSKKGRRLLGKARSVLNSGFHGILRMLLETMAGFRKLSTPEF